jgi:hypothetical protein
MSLFAKKVRVSRWGLLAASLAVAPIFGAMNAAWAIPANTITSGNSTLTFNPTNSSLPFISSWVVDGVDQFGGGTGGGENLAARFPSLGIVDNVFSSLPETSSFFGSGIASITYGEDNFSINVKDILTGGAAGSGASAINEVVTVSNLDTNTNDAPLDFITEDGFAYHVNGTANNDTLTLSPSSSPNTATQTDPSGATVTFNVTPAQNLVAFLNDEATGSNGPTTGNVSFISTAEFEIDPDSSVQISFNEVLTGPTSAAVPLPNSAYSALFMLAGLGAIGGYRKMRRAV